MRLTPVLTVLGAIAPVLAADNAPAAERGLFDLLGGAAWSERRAEAIIGYSSLDIDGVRDDQNAWYFSLGASAVSGYKAKERPVGSILGLGASLKGWYGNDDVKVRSLVPLVYGIAGVYSEFSERTRTELTGRVGPGFAWAKIGDESDTGFAWTWAVEGALTVTKGDGAGVGVGIGYEYLNVDDFEQEGPYVMVRVGF